MCLLDFTHEKNSAEHLGHGFHGNGLGGVPHGAVGNTAPFWQQIEQVVTVLDALRPEINNSYRLGHLQKTQSYTQMFKIEIFFI